MLPQIIPPKIIQTNQNLFKFNGAVSIRSNRRILEPRSARDFSPSPLGCARDRVFATSAHMSLDFFEDCICNTPEERAFGDKYVMLTTLPQQIMLVTETGALALLVQLPARGPAGGRGLVISARDGPQGLLDFAAECRRHCCIRGFGPTSALICWPLA